MSKLSQIATTLILMIGFSNLSLGQQAQNQGLDAASQKALKETQDLLNNPADRKKAVNENASTKAADNYTNNLTGGNAKANDDIYKLAADVFENVVKDAKGDPKKMQEAMDAYMKDPAAFAAKFTPEQQQRLHDISGRLPAAGPSQK